LYEIDRENSNRELSARKREIEEGKIGAKWE